MTAQYISQTSASVANSVADVVITKSNLGTLAVGEVLIARGYSNNNTSTWSSTGWTAFASSGGQTLFFRVVDGTEPSTWTFTRTTNLLNIAAVDVARFSGVDTTTPIDVASFYSGVSSNSVILPSVTTTGNDKLLFQMVARVTTGAATWTPPATSTERYDNTTSGLAIAGGDEVVNSGATGTRTWSCTAASNTRSAMFALNSSGTAKTASESNSIAVSESSSIVSTDGPQGSSDTASISVSEASSINVLDTFKTALANRNTKRVNIGVFGASVVEGYPATLDKSITTKLAKKMRAVYPSTGSGWGYIGIPSTQVTNNNSSPITWVGGTYNQNLGFGEHHGVWAVIPLQNGTLTFVNPADATSINLCTYGWASGHAQGGQYRVNGGSWNVFSTYNATTVIREIVIPGPIAAGAVIEVKHGGGNSNNFFVTGFEHYDGDENIGLQVHNYGHFGYTIAAWQAATGGYPQWSDEIVEQDPDILIISDIGANDAAVSGGNKTSAQFKTDFTALIQRIRTDGYTKPILIAALYDFSAGYPTREPWANYVAVQKQVAKEQGCAFLDLTQSMPATPNAIYDSDNIHGNTNGDAYEIMADRFMAAITDTSYDGAAISITETSSVVASGTFVPSTSDSAAVTITEDSSVFKTITASDTATVSVSETTAFSNSAAEMGADAASISVVEDTDLYKTIVSTDTAAISVDDASAPFKALVASDSVAVTVAEESAVFKTMSATDTTALGVTEASAVFKDINATDAVAVSISDDPILFKTIVASDTLTVSVSETADDESEDLISASDTGALMVSETTSMDIGYGGDDVSAVSVSETRSLFVSILATDGASISIADSTLDVVGGSASDAASISVNETSSIYVFANITASDTASIEVTDDTLQAVAISRTDTGSLAASESTGFTRALTALDNGGLGVSESRASTSENEAADAGSIRVDETFVIDIVQYLNIQLDGAEEIVLNIIERAHSRTQPVADEDGVTQTQRFEFETSNDTIVESNHVTNQRVE